MPHASFCNSETVNITCKTNFADADLAKSETQAAVLLQT
jgi:hypothetical protein